MAVPLLDMKAQLRSLEPEIGALPESGESIVCPKCAIEYRLKKGRLVPRVQG